MRAYRLERSGLGVAGLSIREEPVPEPGPGEVLRVQGADEVVNYHSERPWADTVRALTDWRGVDLVVDVVGQLNQSLQLTGLGGEVAFVGFLAGEGVAPVDVKAFFYSSGTLRAIATRSRSQSKT